MGAYFRNGALSSGLGMLSLGMGAQLRDGGGLNSGIRISAWGWGALPLGMGLSPAWGWGGALSPPPFPYPASGRWRTPWCGSAGSRRAGRGMPTSRPSPASSSLQRGDSTAMWGGGSCLPPPPNPGTPGTVRAPHLAQASGKAPGPGGGRRWSTRGSRPCPWRWSWGAACTRAPGSGRPGAAPGGHRSCRRGRGAGTGHAAGTLRGTGGTVGAGPPSIPSPPHGTLPSPPYSPTLVGSPYLGPGLL